MLGGRRGRRGSWRGLAARWRSASWSVVVRAAGEAGVKARDGWQSQVSVRVPVSVDLVGRGSASPACWQASRRIDGGGGKAGRQLARPAERLCRALACLRLPSHRPGSCDQNRSVSGRARSSSRRAACLREPPNVAIVPSRRLDQPASPRPCPDPPRTPRRPLARAPPQSEPCWPPCSSACSPAGPSRPTSQVRPVRAARARQQQRSGADKPSPSRPAHPSLPLPGRPVRVCQVRRPTLACLRGRTAQADPSFAVSLAPLAQVRRPPPARQAPALAPSDGGALTD